MIYTMLVLLILEILIAVFPVFSTTTTLVVVITLCSAIIGLQILMLKSKINNKLVVVLLDVTLLGYLFTLYCVITAFTTTIWVIIITFVAIYLILGERLLR